MLSGVITVGMGDEDGFSRADRVMRIQPQTRRREVQGAVVKAKPEFEHTGMIWRVDLRANPGSLMSSFGPETHSQQTLTAVRGGASGS